MKSHSEFLSMVVISITVGIAVAVLFGLVFCSPLWYAIALRCMIFAPLGYLCAKREPFSNVLPKNNKILSFVIFVACFTLLFLFVFGMIFIVTDLIGTTLSSVAAFVLALIFSTKWNCKTKKPDVVVDNPINYESDISEDYPKDDSLDTTTEVFENDSMSNSNEEKPKENADFDEDS